MIEFRGSLPAHVLLWIAWIAALLAGEASWVAAILLAPVIFFQVGAALAAAATVAFGVRAGLRRKPRVFLAALVTGTVVLIAGFDAAWGASLFGPLRASDPGGGFLEALAPVLILPLLAVIAGVPAFTVLLGAGWLAGRIWHARAVTRRVNAAIVGLASAALCWIGAGYVGGGYGDYILVAATSANSAGTWTVPGGATLVLSPDGTFTARKLPGQIGNWNDGGNPASGTGTWKAGYLQDSRDFPPGVVLTFAHGNQAELQLETYGHSLSLYYDQLGNGPDGVDDENPSDQFQFFKQPSAPPRGGWGRWAWAEVEAACYRNGPRHRDPFRLMCA